MKIILDIPGYSINEKDGMYMFEQIKKLCSKEDRWSWLSHVRNITYEYEYPTDYNIYQSTTSRVFK